MKIIFIDKEVREFNGEAYEGQFHSNYAAFRVTNKYDLNEPVHVFPLASIREIEL